MAAAAFFDLDRTLLRRSSALAPAGSFRDRGLISRMLEPVLRPLVYREPLALVERHRAACERGAAAYAYHRRAA
jgi:hypothetical protein